MSGIGEALRDEHRELLPRLCVLREAAELVGCDEGELKRSVDAAYHFLVSHLVPHARAESDVLYPVVDRCMGAPRATATVVRDHAEVSALTHELGALRERLAAHRLNHSGAEELRRVLYGLDAIVRLHFAKEEEVYLPLLDAALSAEESAETVDALEIATARAHSASVHPTGSWEGIACSAQRPVVWRTKCTGVGR